jgi:hypothetical protein
MVRTPYVEAMMAALEAAGVVFALDGRGNPSVSRRSDGFHYEIIRRPRGTGGDSR